MLSLQEKGKKGLHPGYIALIVVVSLLILAVIIFVLVYIFKIRPNAKTHGMSG